MICVGYVMIDSDYQISVIHISARRPITVFNRILDILWTRSQNRSSKLSEHRARYINISRKLAKEKIFCGPEVYAEVSETSTLVASYASMLLSKSRKARQHYSTRT